MMCGDNCAGSIGSVFWLVSSVLMIIGTLSSELTEDIVLTVWYCLYDHMLSGLLSLWVRQAL